LTAFTQAKGARVRPLVVIIAGLPFVAACAFDLGYLYTGQDAGTPATQETGAADTGPDDGSLDASAEASDATVDKSADAPVNPIDASVDMSADDSVDASPLDGSVVSVDACTADSPDGNLIQNWSFECGLSPWYAWSGYTVNTTMTSAHTGTWSGVATNRTSNYVGPVQDVTSVVVPGRTYQASAYVTVGLPDGGMPPSQGAGIGIAYQCSDAGQTFPLGGLRTGIVAGEWLSISGPVSVPAGCTLAPGSKVELYIDGPEGGVDLYVDDVVLQ
jgi:hypothetical protein